jgi:hypothetical protein
MDHAPGFTAADDGGAFDPRQAAALLDQAATQARRAFTPGTPALFAFRAVLVLVVFAGCWLSVRGQDPYSGPSGAVLPVAFALVAVNVGWTAWAIRRAGAGVSGPHQRARLTWISAMVVVLLTALDRSAAGTFLLIVVVAVAAGFVGPAGAWLVMGIGLCVACLVAAATAASQGRRGVVRS